jgi:hypothetical protein
MSKEQQFDDIMEAIARLRIAFIRHGMQPPISIELGHVKDADWFRWSMPNNMVMFNPRMGVEKDTPEWVCNIQGVEVRMPAVWRATTTGRRVLYDVEFHEGLPKLSSP